MNKILDLREKRAKAWEQTKFFLDSKRGADGVVTAEDSETYDKMEANVVALGKEVERLERQSAIDAELNLPTTQPIVGKPTTPNSPPTDFRATDEYRKGFLNSLRGKAVGNLLQEGVDADGGYLVPVEFERKIVTGLEEANIIRWIAKTIRTAAERKIPIATSHSTAQWTPENGTYNESTPTFGQTTIDAYKLTDLAKVSVELLQDSMFDLETYLASEFTRAFGIAEEEAFCVGDGLGKPSGIFIPTGGGAIGITTSSPTVVTVDNLIDLTYALKSPYRRNAQFLMRDATVSNLRKLKDGNGMYLWQPSIQQGEPDRLLGYPLRTSPYVPAVAANALPIAFGDFSNYWIADRLGRTVQRLNELYSTNGQVGFICTERVDAKVILPEAIQLLQMST
jgi:HK97 family phage major capsid protein